MPILKGGGMEGRLEDPLPCFQSSSFPIPQETKGFCVSRKKTVIEGWRDGGKAGRPPSMLPIFQFSDPARNEGVLRESKKNS